MAKPLLIIAVMLLVLHQANCQQYKITPTKLAGWGLCAIGGAADGLVEGFEFDGRRSFERKYDVSPTGFWGSQSWRMVYRDGDPSLGFRSPMHRFGALDFYHVGDDIRKGGYVMGSAVVIIGGKHNSKKWHYLVDIGGSLLISAVCKSAAMSWIRK